jgi:hypothetical protein
MAYHYAMGMPVETKSSATDPSWIGENFVSDIFGGQEVNKLEKI